MLDMVQPSPFLMLSSIASCMRPQRRAVRRRTPSSRPRPTTNTTIATVQVEAALVSRLGAHEGHLGAQRRIELHVIDHLDQRRSTNHRHDAGRQNAQIGHQQALEMTELGYAQIHHDQAGHTAGRIHDHEQEHQAQVQQPGLGQLGQQHRSQHQQHGTDDGAEEEGGAAQEGEQQIAARAHHADTVHGRDDLEIDGRQSATYARKKPAMMNAK